MYRIARWLARIVYDQYRPLADVEAELGGVWEDLTLIPTTDTVCQDVCQFAARIIRLCNDRDPHVPR